MKEWFLNKEVKERKMIVIGLYIISFVLMFLVHLGGFFTLLFLATIIFAIVFNVLYVKNNAQGNKIPKKEIHNPVQVNTSITVNTNINYTAEEQKVLFLSIYNRPTSLLENDNYPRYLQYDLGIENLRMYHQKMINESYFELSDIETTLQTMTMEELKNILLLKQIEIKSRKKKDLVEEINLKLNASEKQKIVEDKAVYVLSEKGKQIINENYELIELYNHKDWLITIKEYNQYKSKCNQYMKFRDIIWRMLNDRANEEYLNMQFSQERNVFLTMGRFLEEEGKNLDALYYYLVVLFYDLNCIHSQSNIMQHKQKGILTKEWLKEDVYTNFPLFAPTILDYIKERKEYYKEEIIDKIYSRKRLPYTLLEKDTFANIVNDIFNDTLDEEKYNQLIKNELIKIIESL